MLFARKAIAFILRYQQVSVSTVRTLATSSGNLILLLDVLARMRWGHTFYLWASTSLTNDGAEHQVYLMLMLMPRSNMPMPLKNLPTPLRSESNAEFDRRPIDEKSRLHHGSRMPYSSEVLYSLSSSLHFRNAHNFEGGRKYSLPITQTPKRK